MIKSPPVACSRRAWNSHDLLPVAGLLLLALGTLLAVPSQKTRSLRSPGLHTEARALAQEDRQKAALLTTQSSAAPDLPAEKIVALIRTAEREPDPEAHERVSRELEGVLAGRDPGELVRALCADAFNTLDGTKLVQRWLKHDRLRAAAWLARYPATDMAHAGVLTRDWIVEDAPGLRRYIESLPPGRWRQEVLKAATWHAVELDDLPAAIRLAREVHSADDREGYLLPALLQIAAEPE